MREEDKSSHPSRITHHAEIGMAHINQRISEYVLESPLGKGAFGEVWRAHHHVWTERLVAIKIPTEPNYVRQLQREGASIHGLHHPNIVRAMGFDPYSDPPYLVMEYVPGTSLRPLISERKISIDQSVAILQQMLKGLGYAHSQNLVHRDVKPENILIHEKASTGGFAGEGVVKLTDFGLGRASKAAADSIVLSTSLQGSAAKELAGTIDYMSPEQRSGTEIDGRSDLYAVGVIFFEMLTGERPAGTELPSDLNKSVPKHLDNVFKRSFARLDKRYASAEAFLADLTQNVVSPLSPIDRRCPSCRASVSPGDQFCIHCGTQVVANVRRCPRCGGYPDTTDRFCVFCGEPTPPVLVAIA
jgi:serine/threonine protein kinase